MQKTIIFGALVALLGLAAVAEASGDDRSVPQAGQVRSGRPKAATPRVTATTGASMRARRARSTPTTAKTTTRPGSVTTATERPFVRAGSA